MKVSVCPPRVSVYVTSPTALIVRRVWLNVRLAPLITCSVPSWSLTSTTTSPRSRTYLSPVSVCVKYSDCLAERTVGAGASGRVTEKCCASRACSSLREPESSSPSCSHQVTSS